MECERGPLIEMPTMLLATRDTVAVDVELYGSVVLILTRLH